MWQDHQVVLLSWPIRILLARGTGTGVGMWPKQTTSPGRHTSPGRGSVSHSGHEHQGPGKPVNHLCRHLSKVETRDGVNERDIFRASFEHLETVMWDLALVYFSSQFKWVWGDSYYKELEESGTNGSLVEEWRVIKIYYHYWTENLKFRLYWP